MDLKQPGPAWIFWDTRFATTGTGMVGRTLSECVPVEEGADEATGRAARSDQQPVWFQADPGPDSGAESESSGLGGLLQFRLSAAAPTVISTITCSNVCAFIWLAAANAGYRAPEGISFTRIFGSLACSICRCLVVLVDCLHESRMARFKQVSGCTHWGGESVPILAAHCVDEVVDSQTNR